MPLTQQYKDHISFDVFQTLFSVTEEQSNLLTTVCVVLCDVPSIFDVHKQIKEFK